MAERSSGGFALFEVVVAVALLAISAIAIAEVVTAAVRYAGAAEAARRALVEASAVAETATTGAASASGWQPVGTDGADGLPATADDGASLPLGSQPVCWRRMAGVSRGPGGWLWIEVTCDPGSPAALGDQSIRSTGDAGGRLARRVRLVVAR